MKDIRPSGALARFLVPSAVFWGVVASFVNCVIGGYLAAHSNPYHDVERFHFFLQPTTLFYPTPSQFQQLAREKLDPSKVAVIVGGSSRLHGYGQRACGVWTRKLQELLGDHYQVLNFGFPAASTWEMGAVGAEILSQERPKVILIADCPPACPSNCPDGHAYRYFFWAAYYRGLLLADPQRKGQLKETAGFARVQEARIGGPTEAIKVRAWLDSWLYFSDLWNTCAYRWFCTVWTPKTARSPFRPRRKFEDPEVPPTSLADCYPASLDEQHMRGLKAPLVDCCRKDAEGNWIQNPDSYTWLAFRKNVSACFPEQLHKQTLVIVAHWSPYYLNRLSDDERACVAEAGRISVKELEAIGYSAMENGPELSLADYAEGYHLSESGGAKLAKGVAAKIEDMALRLGYLTEAQ
jgi:hypothetical protein